MNQGRRIPPVKARGAGAEWRLGPFLIDTKTNFTALAAFFLSLVSVASIFRGLLFGPDLYISTIPQVVFYEQRCFAWLGHSFVSVGVPLFLSNLGEKDYPVVISAITAKITLDPSKKGAPIYEYGAAHFAKLKNNREILPSRYPTEKGSGSVQVIHDLHIEDSDSFHNIIIPQGKEFRQDFLFDPVMPVDARFEGSDPKLNRAFSNFIWFDDFKRLMDSDFSLQVHFRFTVLNEGLIDKLVSNVAGARGLLCETPFDKATRELMLSRRYTTRAANCRPKRWRG